MELQANRRTNQLATWSLVASCLGLAMIMPIVGSVIGIVFGGRAMNAIEKSGERGGSRAQAAVIFGWFGVVEGVIAIIALGVILYSAANS